MKKLKKMNFLDALIICCILLLIIITSAGACSFSTTKAYDVVNQYGDTVKIFGSGIYSHDSYFRAPILIGTDIVMLIVVVPVLIISLIKNIQKRNVKSKLNLAALMGTVAYYSASISFGISYNVFHLLYIALFGTSLFALFILVRDIDLNVLKNSQVWELPTKGVRIFLIFSGIALFVAWLPDIIWSLQNGRSLKLIEVYTTEITYVIDMGIISPLMIVCLYLLKKKDGLGDLIFAILLRLCIIIGIMMISQSLLQLLADINIPVPALITKAASFAVLALFAVYFERKLYKGISEKRNEN